MIRHGLAPASKLNENHHQHRRRRRDGRLRLVGPPEENPSHSIGSHLRPAADQSSPCHLICFRSTFFNRSPCSLSHTTSPFQLHPQTSPVPSHPISRPIDIAFGLRACASQPIITFNPSPLPRNYLITLFYIIRQFGCTDRSGEYSTPCNDNCPEAQGLWDAQQGNVF